jgi:hypothetical protein
MKFLRWLFNRRSYLPKPDARCVVDNWRYCGGAKP